MLLKSQRNKFFQELLDKGLQITDFTEKMGDDWYLIECKLDANLVFSLERSERENSSLGFGYILKRRPSNHSGQDNFSVITTTEWHNEIWLSFKSWTLAVKREIDAPDLWLEATKAIQLFESTADPSADKLTIAELGALHGQLRMLAQLFESSELLREHQKELAELTQTAAVKAETFTKKDWQNWVKGAFISVIVSLELNEEQTQELLALVRLAFGGLFLKH